VRCFQNPDRKCARNTWPEFSFWPLTLEAASLALPPRRLSGIQLGTAQTLRSQCRRSAFGQLARVSPADLHIPILGQLASAQLPLGDALEPGRLKVVGSHASLGGGRLRH
jgi:hypothetical protein